MAHIIISLDGNIGAGKSTLLAKIQQEIQGVHIVPEPVSQWTENRGGKNMLELFYEDKARWGYTFQTFALLSRKKNMDKMLKSLTGMPPQIIITERSIATDKYIFADMLHHTGYLSSLEWDLYNDLYDTINQQQSINGIIYVSTSSVVSRERIKRRGRAEEETITMEYLDEIDKQHQKWIATSDVPVVTVTSENAIEKIREFIGTISP